MTAARRVQVPVAVRQMPSDASASTASAVELTVKAAGAEAACAEAGAATTMPARATSEAVRDERAVELLMGGALLLGGKIVRNARVYNVYQTVSHS
ncbi:hypothetical protein ACQF36_28100 [Streptomyces sp. Marseille-Q5077]|uniref:hypothetical protein n=1 Tax=Streptomyces sp. Marseille-Q5077 TaxID=3418995 RepID=UPI003D068482